MTKDNTNKKNKNNEKPIQNKNFGSIPEVLTVTEVADYLRIDEKDVLHLIDQESIKPLPGTGNTRIFKGFLFAFLTQNAPKDIGLAGGASEGQTHLNPGVGF